VIAAAMMKSGVVEKFGTIGALLAAACPACFPMLAVVGTALGLGILSPFEGWVFVVFQIFVAAAVFGTVFSFVRHHRVFSFIIGLTGPALIFFALYVRFSQALLYLGLFGLAAASALNYVANRQCARCEPNP
jgi:mercuric ion transport protein